MAKANLVRISNLSFSYFESEPLIEGLSLVLSAGQRIALTGPNGCGKSTLLRLIVGQLQAREGAVVRESRVSVLSQDASGEHPNLSGGESRWRSFEAAFQSQADFLLLDEPTNDLDEESKMEFFQKLANFSGAALIVSHDPQVLDSVDEIWELKKGRLQKHPPGYLAYVERIEGEERRLVEQIASLERDKRDRESQARLVTERQEKRAQRGKLAGIRSNLPKIVRGHKKRKAEATLAKLNDVHSKRLQASEAELESARRRLRQISVFKWDTSVSKPPHSKRLISVLDLKMRGFQTPLSFEVLGPKRVHLAGRNGSGKSTLLRALSGDTAALSRVSGSLSVGVPFHLFDQKLSQFSSPLPLWEWFHARISRQISEARQILGRLGFEQEEQERPVLGLSGGEKVRLELAAAVYAREVPQLLLLDEPTNHLDLESRRILVEFLKSYEGALLLVSHDQRFLQSLSFDMRIDLDELVCLSSAE
jgi:ATPase subunit of ABC transporter with duplicated ATPase domains